MSRLFCAAVKLVHLNEPNFAVLLQIKEFNVPRGKGDDVGRGAMGNVFKACDQNNNKLQSCNISYKSIKDPDSRRGNKLSHNLWLLSRLRGIHRLWGVWTKAGHHTYLFPERLFCWKCPAEQKQTHHPGEKPSSGSQRGRTDAAKSHHPL